MEPTTDADLAPPVDRSTSLSRPGDLAEWEALLDGPTAASPKTDPTPVFDEAINPRDYQPL